MSAERNTSAVATGDAEPGGAAVREGSVFAAPDAEGVSPLFADSGQIVGFDRDAAAQKATKKLTCGLLGLVPYGGKVLGGAAEGLLDAFWPDQKNDVWESIRDKVAVMIDAALRGFCNDLMVNDLKKLMRESDEYRKAAKDVLEGKEGRKEDARSYWTGAVTKAKDLALVTCRNEAYRYGALPVYAQAANMHLALLREKALHGDKIDFRNDSISAAVQELKQYGGAGGEHTSHVMKTYKKPMLQGGGLSWTRFFDWQREMWLAAAEYTLLWAYVDKLDTKPPEEIPRNVELFLGPFGKFVHEQFEEFVKPFRSDPLPRPPMHEIMNGVIISAKRHPGVYRIKCKFGSEWAKGDGYDNWGCRDERCSHSREYDGCGGGVREESVYHPGPKGPPWKHDTEHQFHRLELRLRKNTAAPLSVSYLALESRQGRAKGGAQIADLEYPVWVEYWLDDWCVSQVRAFNANQSTDHSLQSALIGLRPFSPWKKTV
ncbi:insecticidal delta-endotoxin Cry8Ea1 family protein [Streptomyces sp. NPDC018019]|uniref:insecticidal delta-endotoxin Cry8Ea1 family protein n=1 Tax=Streptomyces sp. NPDC018019 TaxID=3365030 RepID=UPI003789D88A